MGSVNTLILVELSELLLLIVVDSIECINVSYVKVSVSYTVSHGENERSHRGGSSSVHIFLKYLCPSPWCMNKKALISFFWGYIPKDLPPHPQHSGFVHITRCSSYWYFFPHSLMAIS